MFVGSDYSELLFDLLENLLVLNPKKRLTVKETLNHKFFTSSDSDISPTDTLRNMIK